MSDTPWNMTRTADLHHDPAFRERVDMIRDLDRLRAVNAELVAALEAMLPLVRLLTIRQVVQAGDDAINAVGLNPLCIAEGLATGDEPVSVSKFERAIGNARSALAAAERETP